VAPFAPSQAGQQVSSSHHAWWAHTLSLLRTALCGMLLAVCAPAHAQETSLSTIEWLHAGEAGPTATALGDRVRLALWLRELEPTGDQLDAMEEASRAITADLARLESSQRAGDLRDVETRLPVYREILEQMASDTEAPLEEADFTPDTSEVRAQMAERVKLTRSVLNEASRFTRSLGPDQREAMQHAIFLLRRPTARYASPDFYDRLMASAWPDSAFASLRRVADPGATKGPESLWLLDEGRLDVAAGLTGTALDLVTALALGHALLPDAIAFHRGWIGVDLYLGKPHSVAHSATEREEPDTPALETPPNPEGE
jgi:hypothetical protein